MRITILGVALCAMSLSAIPARAAEYGGKLSLTENGKPAAGEEYADVVVYFVPKTPAAATPLKDGAEMRMEKKSFAPRVLPVTLGTEVRFPNVDPILHNAFSTSTNNAFDLQLYGGGEAKLHKFDSAGLVRMYCNVHHSMVGYILVLDTPYYARISAAGDFALKDLPTAGDLYLWHPRGEVVKQALDLSQGVPAGTFKMELTQRRIPQHTNKEGKSYRRSREDAY
ncbi:MAG: methylamine utilization protein [Gammaproteobacteria bacterium]|nr:methylamine utilization protein [Gammaproteobacteria bacterium]